MLEQLESYARIYPNMIQIPIQAIKGLFDKTAPGLQKELSQLLYVVKSCDLHEAPCSIMYVSLMTFSQQDISI